MVSKEVLKLRLKHLAEYISDLKEIQPTSWEDFKGDKVQKRYTERTLHLAIEACIDVANHIIADLKLREPASNRDVFIILRESNILPEDKLQHYTRMAQFRNVIVHDYTRVDPEIVYQVLQHDLDDIVFFARRVKKEFLE